MNIETEMEEIERLANDSNYQTVGTLEVKRKAEQDLWQGEEWTIIYSIKAILFSV